MEKQSIEQFKSQTRLPKFAVPKHYDLSISTDLSNCTFSGLVKIELAIVDITRLLVLNALELVISEVLFVDSVNQKCVPCGMVINGEDEKLILEFEEDLNVGDGVLEINFSGALNEHLKGFYKCTYTDGEVKKNMAATQFEAVEARRCFPCWDEPALKATFKIAVEAPSELTVLSNMPVLEEKIIGPLKTVHFEKTPIMSTYLVAIVIGLFDYIEDTADNGVKVRAYCPVGKSGQGKYAVDLAVKTLNLYKRYFSMPYALPKLDMVAVPDFPAGAMENYGLNVYREIVLLHDEFNSTALRKQQLAIVVAHEVAHQWFGNLVTMEWWTHLWLNEGFATWVSYLATDNLFPEWEIWTQFLDVTSGGLRMDALDTSHPIEVEIHHARSVDEAFDIISYQKGSAIIRMLMDYIGDDIFQKSLSSYMKTYAWKNAKTNDLWSALSKESGVQVTAMMSTWTKKKGYPVISVKYEQGKLELQQSQFLYSGLHSDDCWIVPISLSVGSYENNKNFLLETKSSLLDISELYDSTEKSSSWIKLNSGQAGFYRVKYDEKLTHQLMKAIEDNCVSSSDKFGILDDTYALCEARQVSFMSLLSLMNVYRKELNYVVLSRLIEVCIYVANISSDAAPNSVPDMKQFFISLLLFSAGKLGWESEPGESHLSTMLREEVLTALVQFGHDKTIGEALKRFQAHLKVASLPVGIRKVVYTAVMRTASATNREGFELLLNLYLEEQEVQEKTRVLRCIASSPDPSIVLEVLNFMLSDKVRSQDTMYVLGGISSEGHETAWIWLKENWDRIVEKCGHAMVLHYFIREIIMPFCSHEMADEVERFFASRETTSFAMNLKQSIEQVRIKARWVEKIKQEESLAELVSQLARAG